MRSTTTSEMQQTITKYLGHHWGSLGHHWGALGHTLGTLWVPWASLATPWTPLGHPLGSLGHPPGAPFGLAWALLGRLLGPLGHPFSSLGTHLGGHFCHLASVSPKRSKQSLFWDTSLTSFREGCPYMQSDHACAVRTHIWTLFLTPFSRA